MAILCKAQRMDRNAMIKELMIYVRGEGLKCGKLRKKIFNYSSSPSIAIQLSAMQITFYSFLIMSSSIYFSSEWIILSGWRLAHLTARAAWSMATDRRSLLRAPKVRLLLDFKCVCVSLCHTQSFLPEKSARNLGSLVGDCSKTLFSRIN